ncbi:MAG: helix-turn-helix transcriptional regulator [Elusimicrobiaceae bacterium]|nr:helix-turn-helix transcriptional regulator [Elusimicrobiaceae bacterium]
MNKFEKQLEKWNNGILRGAQAKLAKQLQVSTATVALWATGQRHPSKGYLAKMAQLFKMDIYDVSRLFMSATVYPQRPSQPQHAVLYENKSFARYSADAQFNLSYAAQETVSLPVFTSLPPEQLRQQAQAKTWWILPQKDAKQAHFLFLLPATNDPDRLLFIQIASTWTENRFMLAYRKKNYQIVWVTFQKGKPILTNLQRKIIPIRDTKPIGLIIRQVTRLQFAP